MVDLGAILLAAISLPVKPFLCKAMMMALDGEKLVSCCKTVSRKEVTDPITGYWIQNYNAPCVPAVIFEMEKGLFCSYHRQPWVHRKIQQFE
uniref:Chemokine interleukin-8-like domain-containing protein n=1 Tax=Salmo trutta TaxID=8032 RepID=A0A674CUF9_SALTR